jgi:hypothetical protein
MRWVKHVACMAEGSKRYSKDRNYLEDNTTTNLKKQNGSAWTGLM